MNESPFSITISFRIKVTDQNKANYQIPISTFSFQVNPHTNMVCLCLCKFDPFEDWGEMKIRY